MDALGVDAESSLRLMLESAPDAIVIVDSEGEIVRVNGLASRLFGYSAGELIGQPIEMLLSERQRARHLGHRRRYAAHPQPRPMGEGLDPEARRRDGSTFPVEISLSPVEIGDRRLFVSSIRDVSEQRRAQAELRFLAEHDPLTGLRNRRRFEDDLAELVARAQRYDEQAALLVLDVDDFKTINDTHGHGAGDETLRAIATALRRRLRQTDVIARIGGDEFAVLLSHVNRTSAAKTAADLRSVITECEIRVDGAQAITPAISIGVAIIDRHTASEDAALTEADQEMYRDKAARRRSTPP